MTALIANAKSFLINPDYPLDKIIWTRDSSVVVPAFDFNDTTISHGLSFKPLVKGIWSLTSDFSVSYEMNTGPMGGNPYTFNTSTESNATNVIFRVSNNTASSATVYYRLYAFMPTGGTYTAGFTNVSSDNFMLSSDFNYTKLYEAGVTPSSASGVTTVVPHNFGYHPQVIAWEENMTSGTIFDVCYLNKGDSAEVSTTTTSVSLTNSMFGGASRRIHYRIYLDD